MSTKELEGRQHVALMITPGVRRRQKQPLQSPKTPSRSVPVPQYSTLAKAGRLTGASPSGSTSTTTTTTTSTTPSTTWTMYENPCFCSSHFYSDYPLSATHRHRRRHHHHHYHRKAPTPERSAVRDQYHRNAPSTRDAGATSTPIREQLGTVLERERATVALEREKAMREEAEKLAEALRLELARERRRREEAEGRAAKESEEAARWKAEAERMEGEVRAAKEMGNMQERRARAEVAETVLRFEEEKRKLQMEIHHVQPAVAVHHDDPNPTKLGAGDTIQCDHIKEPHQKQHHVAPAHQSRPGSTSTAAANHSPAATPCQKQQQPKKDASPASVENPHIRRGIIGFVEFPRVVGRSRGGLLGGRDGIKPAAPPKLECQKAQLRVLLKGGGGKVTPVAGFPTTGPPHNLVM